MYQQRFEIRRYENRRDSGAAAAGDVARCVRELLKEKDEVNMIFAAAPSQNEFLRAFRVDDSVDFSRVNAFHMDEYVGLAPTAPQRFGTFLYDMLFYHVPFKAVHYIDGNAEDIKAECARYGGLLAQFPPDIVCMGIGENGHIAFNDPHVADFRDREAVKRVQLDATCRQQQVNDGCFLHLGDVPAYALTLTIPTLAQAAHHFCIVPGPTKARAVYETVFGPICAQCPATVLRLCRNATLYLDEESGVLLGDGYCGYV